MCPNTSSSTMITLKPLEKQRLQKAAEPVTIPSRRMPMHHFLSHLTTESNVTSLEIVVDNPKSFSPLYGQHPKGVYSRESSACRWGTFPKLPNLERKNSMENLQGLVLPARPLQENPPFLVIQDSTDEIFDVKTSKAEASSSQILAYSSSPRLIPLPPPAETDSDWSDMFPSESEEELRYAKQNGTNSRDAALSAALICTIERLAISAALSMTRKPRKSSKAEAIVDDALFLTDNSKDGPTPEECCNGKIPGDSEERDSSFGSTESKLEDAEIVRTFVRRSLCQQSSIQSSNAPVILTEDLLREVDRIAVRAALTMTNETYSTD
ncbi:hypothetical protein IV203_024171 [Nitzschia inconspicua]|uniref:Uncharacterized protein n=1 Tax=Nitzschia inconspicua TaxID=303405 RepID=A0A9K3KBU0_9STRA|nr:hypothetical protein IV203_024171 [Nitzschia inconspicua]